MQTIIVLAQTTVGNLKEMPADQAGGMIGIFLIILIIGIVLLKQADHW
jgi:hypothetical protein